MSWYGPRQPSSAEDGSRAMPSSRPQPSCLPDFPCGRDGLPDASSHDQNPNPNPPRKNQTLEDAFARLCVSPHNHPPSDFLVNGAGPNGAAKVFALDGHGFPSHRSNVGHMQENNIGLRKLALDDSSGAANSGAMPSQNCWVECDRDSGSLKSFWPGSYPTSNASGYSSNHNGFLDFLHDSEPFLRQTEFGRAFPTVPLSIGNGDELFFDLQQKSRNGILNELFINRSSTPRFNVHGKGPHWLQQPLNHVSVYDLQGKVLSLAKDQYGCRILQETMKSMTTDEISIILFELIDHIIDLMVDPFGNYVIQKMVEVCSEEQRTHIILMVTKPDFPLVSICLNVHGTRAVQKLLEHVTTHEQRSLIMSALSPGAVALTKDINGHHVILHCLKHFSDEDNMYLLNMVANNCFGIASDKSGCCVLQQCVNHARGETKMHLIAEIIVNASLLAEDCYGNYVVQHLVSLKIPGVTESLLRQLEGKFLSLSCNKYGSNVVEKFFQDSGEQHSTRIILELLRNPDVSRLLVDPYGNYVIKSALLVSKGAIRNALLELVQLNAPMMRSNLYGKKLLARFDRGKVRQM